LNTADTLKTASSVEIDALEALMALGIGRAMAESAIKKTLRSAENTDNLEELIKQALKNL
jgi:Holliday junction DNA helicase RuvA